jgi:hypothetical protein
VAVWALTEPKHHCCIPLFPCRPHARLLSVHAQRYRHSLQDVIVSIAVISVTSHDSSRIMDSWITTGLHTDSLHLQHLNCPGTSLQS